MKKTILGILSAFLFIGTSCAQQPKQEAKAAEPAKVETATAESTLKVLDANIMGEDIVKNIIAAHKGQVVLVDFWATWCPPCRRAMTEIDNIKPELQKKGTVFVYITGETSPIDKFNEMQPAIAGEHYRLSGGQWNSLMKAYKVDGIPFYMLINKDGSQAKTSLGYPGNDVIKNDIEVALTK